MSDEADFYTGIVPAVYTALRATHFDPEPYLRLARSVGEPLLEVGCGDEGPFLDLLRAGLEVDGVDSSADMIQRCRERLAAEGLRSELYCQPMQELSLPREYAGIYLAGPTFTLLPDDETAGAALERFAAHLRRGGVAMVPLWIPGPTPEEAFGQERVAEASDGTRAGYVVVGEEYGEEGRTRTTHTRYTLGEQSVERDWVIHWHTSEGFAALASTAGLAVEWGQESSDSEPVAYLRHS